MQGENCLFFYKPEGTTVNIIFLQVFHFLFNVNHMIYVMLYLVFCLTLVTSKLQYQ